MKNSLTSLVKNSSSRSYSNSKQLSSRILILKWAQSQPSCCLLAPRDLAQPNDLSQVVCWLIIRIVIMRELEPRFILRIFQLSAQVGAELQSPHQPIERKRLQKANVERCSLAKASCLTTSSLLWKAEEITPLINPTQTWLTSTMHKSNTLPSKQLYRLSKKLKTRSKLSTRCLLRKKRVRAKTSWTPECSKVQLPCKSRLSCSTNKLCSSCKLWRAWSQTSYKNSSNSSLLSNKSSFYCTSNRCRCSRIMKTKMRMMMVSSSKSSLQLTKMGSQSKIWLEMMTTGSLTIKMRVQMANLIAPRCISAKNSL